MERKLWKIVVVIACLGIYVDAGDIYNVGIGISDTTGPIAEVTLMGYANVAQVGGGLHTRLFSRAFIFEKDNERIIYVWTDLFSIGPIVKKGVISRVQSLYGNLYSEQNVILAGSHSHSVPGGYLGHLMYDISIRGYVNQTAEAYIDGITRSIVRAHDNIVPSTLEYSETNVYDASINRSPTSYLENPAEERARYASDTETRLQQLRVLDATDGALRGLVNWFAVHPTSLNMTNLLVSSDNMGYAALRLEKHFNNGAHPGTGRIVAAFAQSAQGDISPNTAGPRCEISGDICDNQNLLCPTVQDKCFASGPGEDMYDSAKIIGTYLYDGALRALQEEPSIEIVGPLAIRQQYVNMEEATGYKYDPIGRTFDTSEEVSGCVAAMGYSFAAGTTDGAGLLNFTQGEMEENPLLVYIRDFLGEPTEEDIICQSPKPILLATGRTYFPYAWHPSIVSMAIGRIGNFLIASIPSEFTTQSGRRLRDVMERIASEYSDDNFKAVVSGFSDDYSHYVTTFEEYQAQRYEAASTLYGPHTLDIYLTNLANLQRSVFEGTEIDRGTPEQEFFDNLLSFVLPVVRDGTASGYDFGDCVEQPNESYSLGETVVATFVSGHPRNNLRQEGSFAYIERLYNNGSWEIIATDADWETKFRWQRVSTLLATSRVSIEWEIPEDTYSGTYRLHVYGDSRSILGTVTPYEGLSNEFYVQGLAFPEEDASVSEETPDLEDENEASVPEEELTSASGKMLLNVWILMLCSLFANF